MEKTENEYTINILGMKKEDNGTKYSCVHDDGEDQKTLETYKLKLSAGKRYTDTADGSRA